MIEYKLATEDYISEICDFIAKINSEEESHIGYCGINSEEIENSLIEDITDIPFHESFIISIEDGEIVGVLGFDADFDCNNAEIWGPFIEKDKWDIVDTMWSRMIEILPKQIESISMFINKKNNKCITIAKELKFNKVSEQTILTFNRYCVDRLQDTSINELSTSYYSDLKSLHDRVFSNTYYNGNQLIERLNAHRKVFIDTHNNKLVGYIYLEVNPKFGEGSVEFFAVDELHRGKGKGKKLLTMALKWIFTFDSISNITICVNSQNVNAIKLYKSVGFNQDHQLYYFTKSR